MEVCNQCSECSIHTEMCRNWFTINLVKPIFSTYGTLNYVYLQCFFLAVVHFV